MNRSEALSIVRQCELLDLPRSTFYHEPLPVSDDELRLMRLIDECHLKLPFYGARRIRGWLADRDLIVNRKRIQRLMRTMGLTAIYPKRNTSKANHAHKIYPYLLKGLTIDRPNRVWSTDITYSVPGVQGEHGCSNEPRVYLEY